jgi:hypothetical protein
MQLRALKQRQLPQRRSAVPSPPTRQRVLAAGHDLLRGASTASRSGPASSAVA